MNAPLVEATGLSHSFDYPLYRDVNVTLCAGESTAIIGRSGSGKSTLLHTLATFLPPDEGRVMLLGQDLYHLSQEQVENIRRHELGIVFQTHYLFKGMTGRENVVIASLLAKEKIDPKLLEKLEISEVIDQKTSDLSGGQQQRISIARVLSKRPRVIFADEPTGNLDKETAKLVMDVLHDYIKESNATLFLVTHDEEIAKSCDHCYQLQNYTLEPL